MLDFEQERNLAAEFYRQKRNIPEENTMAVMQAEMQIFAQKLMLAHARVRTLALLRSSNKKLEQKRIESLQRVQSEINALKQELEMELKYVSEQVQEYVRDQVREPINAIEYELAQLLGSQEELKQATTSTALIVKHSLSLMQRLNEKLTKNSKKQQLEKRLAAVEQKLKQALNYL